MKPQGVIMIGAGGHALSICEFASGKICGYLAKEQSEEMPGNWLGSDSEKEALIKSGHKFHMAFIYSGLPSMKARKELIASYEAAGAEFVSLVSPLSVVTPKTLIGEGCAIMTGAIINRAKLGRNVVVNSGAIVEHDVSVGDNSFIGPGAVIGGFTKIGRDCFIGLGARVGNGLVIGDNVSVAMGAVVNRNLIEPGIYHGNPLRRFNR